MKSPRSILQSLILKNRGFTLVELIVVFSMVSILAGMGLVSFSSYSQKQIIVQAARDLGQTINLARNDAISFIRPSSCSSGSALQSYTVNFCYLGNPSCTSGFTNGYELRADCQPQYVYQKKLPTGVSFDGTIPNGTTLCQNVSFKTVNPQVTGVPCSINLKYFNRILLITINSGGYVSF